MIRIIIDSASDIKPEQARQMNIDIAPLRLDFEGKTYTEGKDITVDEFYGKLINAETLPKTSQPSPDTFAALMKPYAEAGDDIICILLSTKFSGTYQSASIAAEILDYDKIHLVDSGSASVGVQILIKRAVAMRDSGCTAEEICEKLRKIAEKVVIYGMVETLKYLKMGGRLSSTAATVGTLLKIRPIIKIVDGEVQVVGKARSRKAGFDVIRTLMSGEKVNAGESVIYAYTHNSENMEAMEESFSDVFDGCNVEQSAMGAVIGTHVGPGICAVAYVQE